MNAYFIQNGKNGKYETIGKTGAPKYDAPLARAVHTLPLPDDD